MNTHAEILGMLEREHAEFVPKRQGTPLERFVPKNWDENGYEYRYDIHGVIWCVSLDDAHAHIELAAWKAVRGWARLHSDSGLVIEDWESIDGVRRDVNLYYFVDGDRKHFADGPDDATALLAALRTISQIKS